MGERVKLLLRGMGRVRAFDDRPRRAYTAFPRRSTGLERLITS
jgi:hypothetical protein